MLAARFLGHGRIELVDRPVPEPGPGELLLRNHACASCGTDRGAYVEGSTVTPGHEIAGTVVAAGGDEAPAGTAGVVYLVDFCGECYACRRGSTNMCLDRRRMYGFTADGGFAEYVAVRARCFLPVGGAVPLDTAPALLDLFGTPLHALRRAGVDGASTAAVIGCGPVGLGAVAVARALGIAAVYAVDIAPYRLALAEQLGAIVVDAAAADPVTRILEHAPDGCEIVVEAAGLTETQRQAIEVAAPGGCVVVVAHNHDALPVLTLADLIQRERSLVGSEYFPIGTFPDTLALVASRRVDPAPLLTHRFPLERIEEAFEAFWSRETGKVLVEP